MTYSGDDPQIIEMVNECNAMGGASRQIQIKAEYHPGAPLTVTKNGMAASVVYGNRVEAFRGLGLLREHAGEEDYHTVQPRRFRSAGVMVDCSRNAVLKEEAVQRLVRYMALMGLDTLMLYTENTYEVPEYPYFGYMRGRYSAEELRRMDAYASAYGVELVPCIQTLAHLEGALRWSAFSGVKDTDEILLIDEEETYRLIEAMIRACRKGLSSKQIHIGMDEALMMGLGRYRQINGDQPRLELFCRHLKRVADICEQYGFRPMMWSDMFFRLVSGGYYDGDLAVTNIHELVPKDAKLVYWDYYQEDRNTYERNICRHHALSNPLVFAGGSWRWAGYAPSVEYSLDISRKALDACVAQGVEETFLTAWGDDGSDGSMFSILPVMQLYAEYAYGMPADDNTLEARLQACTGESLTDMLLLDLPNQGGGKVNNPACNPCKYLLLQDPLCGLFDAHIHVDMPQRYTDYAQRLHQAGGRSSSLGYVFETLSVLCRLLARKCEMAIHLHAAYGNGDRAAVGSVAIKELPAVLETLAEFRQRLEEQWFAENRPIGFEVQDIRLGGLEARLKSAARRLTAFSEGRVPCLEELEEPRLPFDGTEKSRQQAVACNIWQQIATACKL